MNPITGEKLITISGAPYTLRFTWRALAEIEAAFGENPNLLNAEVLAFAASAGLRDKHPEMTKERIMELSPPLVPFAATVQEAMRWAYFGASPAADPDGGVKKNLPKDGLFRRIGRLLSPG